MKSNRDLMGRNLAESLVEKKHPAPFQELEKGDFHYRRENRMPREVLGKLLDEFVNEEKDVMAADTTGADFFFLLDFLTFEMQLEFEYIAQDFLKNCFSRIHSFEIQTWYGEDSIRDSDPKSFEKKRILTLMYNGAKSGDRYCIELYKYLYKTYHKQEYKQLKRFRKISADELLSLAESELEFSSSMKLGRLMGMCRLMDIEMEESCAILYRLLNREREEWLEDSEIQDPYDDNDTEDLFEQCIEQVEEWMEQEEKLPAHKQNKVYRKLEKYSDYIMSFFLYPEGYVMDSLENYRGLKLQYTRTLWNLKKMYPNREFTFEDVQMYAQIYTLSSSIANMGDYLEEVVESLLGDAVHESYFEDDRKIILYQPGTVKEYQSDSSAASVKKASPSAVKEIKSNIVTPDTANAELQACIEEIESLRNRVNMQEKEISHLRTVNRQVTKDREEQEILLQKQTKEREELLALRNFVYNLEHSEPEQTTVDLEMMKQYIAEKKITIVGGHTNWLKKIEQVFPNWRIVHEDNRTHSTVDGRVFDGMDRVYFFTDHISHRNYNKYIALLRDRTIPFSYLHVINLDQVIRQIYNEMMSE